MKTLKIKLDNKTIEVSKLPIGKYAELLKALKELSKSVNSKGGFDPDKAMEQLPEVIANNIPEALNLLAIATPLTVEELNELGLDELVRIVVGIFEVNNYKEVYEQVKKAIAQPKQPTQLT